MTRHATPRRQQNLAATRNARMPLRRMRRQATLTICGLVCLLVAASLAGATTHAALRWRRSMRIHHQLRQTELLLDAGILRAAKQIRRSADYLGETWRPSQASVGFESPRVEIRVQPGDAPQTRLVEVIAELGSPLSDLERSNVSHTRRSHRFSVSVDGDSQESDSQESDSQDPDSQNTDTSSPE